MVGELWRRLIAAPLAVAATIGGALLVTLSLVGGVGLESAALEVGAGLLLAVVIYAIDESLRSALSREVERVDRRVDDVTQAVDELERTVHGEAAHNFARTADQAVDGMIDAFVAAPSVESLRPIVQELKRLSLSVATNLYPTEDCLLNVTVAEERVQVRIKGNGQGSRRFRDVRDVFWLEGSTYGDFVKRLGSAWVETGLYPGHESFESFDFAGELAAVFAQRIGQRYNPGAATDGGG